MNGGPPYGNRTAGNDLPVYFPESASLLRWLSRTVPAFHPTGETGTGTYRLVEILSHLMAT
ncbi:MAG: hypothetical protein R3A46_03995 [Thermomicrobiales bacterium]